MPAGFAPALPPTSSRLQLESPDEFGWQFGGNLATLVVKNGIRCA